MVMNDEMTRPRNKVTAAYFDASPKWLPGGTVRGRGTRNLS